MKLFKEITLSKQELAFPSLQAPCFVLARH